MVILTRWCNYLFVQLLFSVDFLKAADVCYSSTAHKDVDKSIVAGIVERSRDGDQCVTRCATLKNTLPCRSAVHATTSGRGAALVGVCQMYSRSAGQNLVNVAEPGQNDATYYELQDQCNPQSLRVVVDNGGPGDQGGTTINPVPNVILVRPAPGTGPGTDPNGPNGLFTIQPGAVVATPPPLPPPPPQPTTTKAPPGPFVPIPSGPSGPAPAPPPPAPAPPPPNGGVYQKPSAGYNKPQPQPQPQPAGYAAWSQWTACSVTCDGGVMYRYRSAGSPDKELKTCLARKACPKWGPWTDWNPCSSAYGGGQQTRTRPCQGDYGCSGQSTDSRPCGTYQPQPQAIYLPQPQPYVPPQPAPGPSSYYVALQRQYYRNRG